MIDTQGVKETENYIATQGESIELEPPVSQLNIDQVLFGRMKTLQ